MNKSLPNGTVVRIVTDHKKVADYNGKIGVVTNNGYLPRQDPMASYYVVQSGQFEFHLQTFQRKELVPLWQPPCELDSSRFGSFQNCGDLDSYVLAVSKAIPKTEALHA